MRLFSLAGLGIRLNQLLDIRAREWTLLSLLLLHFALTQMSMSLLQSVHLGLLLHHFEKGVLPFYFLGKGFFLFLISWFYSVRIIGRVSKQVEVLSFLALIAAVLILIRTWAFVDPVQIGTGYLCLSVVVEIFISMFTLQCWGLYSDYLDSRQSKRLMPLIGSAGTFGAMMGGWFCSFAVHYTGSENLLIVGFFLISCIAWLSIRLLLKPVMTSPTQDSPSQAFSLKEHSQEIFTKIFSDRLLLSLMLIIMSVKLAMNLTEYQQQILLKADLSQDQITAFLGYFLAISNLIALLIQLFFENRLIQSMGPLFGLLITPLCTMSSGLGFILFPGLLANSIGRSLEMLTHKSVYKTSVNLVYLTFPSELRRKLRIVINGLLEFFAIVPFILVTIIFPRLPLWAFSVGALMSGSCALVLVFVLRKPYQKQLQSNLQSRSLKLDEDVLGQSPAYSRQSYSKLAQSYLQSNDSTQIRFALELAQKLDLSLEGTLLEPLLRHSEPDIRQYTLGLWPKYAKPEQLPTLFALLASENDSAIRQIGMRTLRFYCDESHLDSMAVYLNDPAIIVRTETLVNFFICGGIEGILKAAQQLKNYLQSESVEELKIAAYIIGETGSQYFRKDLIFLFENPHLEVKLQALKAIQHLPDPFWIPYLLEAIQDHHYELSYNARLGLQNFQAEQIIPQVESLYTDMQKSESVLLSLRIQTELIYLLAHFKHPQRIELLQKWLSKSHWRLKSPLIRALNQIRNSEGISQDLIEDSVIYLEIQTILHKAYACIEVLAILKSNQEQRVTFMISELNLYLQEARDLLFSLLSLLYDSTKIQQAALNYASGNQNYRAISLDVLGQILGRDIGPAIITLLEDSPVSKKLYFARQQSLLPEASQSPWWQKDSIQNHPYLRPLADWCRYNEITEEESIVLESIYILKQTALFANLGIEQLELVAKICKLEQWPANKIVLAEKAPAKALYIICSGSVSVEFTERQVAVLKQYNVFGEVEVLHAAPNLATVRTLEPSQFLVMSRQDFVDLIEDYPSFSKALVAILFDRLRESFERSRDHVIR